ncbi:hypothetical protein SAMN05216316_2705 [Nitrosovibrio sp. Nv6]|nr:hypothetical protein SAMN05216316_2705 [Nitrosovibrio sp. Nv6]
MRRGPLFAREILGRLKNFHNDCDRVSVPMGNNMNDPQPEADLPV